MEIFKITFKKALDGKINQTLTKIKHILGIFSKFEEDL